MILGQGRMCDNRGVRAGRDRGSPQDSGSPPRDSGWPSLYRPNPSPWQALGRALRWGGIPGKQMPPPFRCRLPSPQTTFLPHEVAQITVGLHQNGNFPFPLIIGPSCCEGGSEAQPAALFSPPALLTKPGRRGGSREGPGWSSVAAVTMSLVLPPPSGP